MFKTIVSDEWMRGVANISYSMTLILRPGDNDPDISYGYTLPEQSKSNASQRFIF